MTLNPIERHILGTGNPRLVVITETIYTSSNNVLYDDTHIYIGDIVNLEEEGIRVNQYVRSTYRTDDGLDEIVWAKIVDIDDDNDIITIDRWIDNTPTNYHDFTVEGWVADLPKPEKLVEKFEPEYLIHNLWQGRKETILFGFNYTCEIHYDTNIYGDYLAELSKHLTKNKNHRLIFVPRMNNLDRQYNVIFDNDINFEKTRLGYKGFVIYLKGTELISDMSLETGYGSNYATNYGIYL